MAEPDSYEIRVLGAQAHPLRDFYHALLRWSWSRTFAVLAAVFLGANAAFALAYLGTGGIAHARPGSFADAFVFSVQTMGTIGYGALYPAGAGAHVLVVLESFVGLALTALVTGLVFAKFSLPTGRLVFSRDAVVSAMNGVPTLSFRIGHDRGNQIVDAQVRVSLTRTERTTEGRTFYRQIDLALARERILSLSRSWNVLHPIDDRSPLQGADAARLEADEVELQVLVVGLDDTTMQPVHGTHRYLASRIRFGMRHADVLSEAPDGALVLDVRKFHDLEPAS